MKILKLLLASTAIFLIIVALIENESIIDFLKKNTAAGFQKRWKPDQKYIEEYNKYKPELLTEQGQGKWVDDKENQYKLTRELVIGNEEDDSYRFFLPLDIEVDAFGDVYLLDNGHQRIQVFDSEGKFLRSIDRENGFPSVAVDISINSENVIAVADKQKRKIFLFSDFGKKINDFSLSYEPIEVALFNNEFIVLGINTHFLVHRYSNDGVKMSSFCPIIMKNESVHIRKIFNEAHLDIDFNDNIFVTYEYPYRIIKHDNHGIPKKEFNRLLPDDITPPIISDKTNGIQSAKKRTISMGIKVDLEGYVYNLIRSAEESHGDRIDRYDGNGNYLYTFYLDESIDDFTLYRNDIIWCLIGGDKNKIIKYRIEKVII